MRVIYARRVRECAKLGCRRPAEATAAMRYRERVVWLGDLVPERDPNLFDLCAPHADSMSAPYAWRRIDERSAGRPRARRVASAS